MNNHPSIKRLPFYVEENPDFKKTSYVMNPANIEVIPSCIPIDTSNDIPISYPKDFNFYEAGPFNRVSTRYSPPMLPINPQVLADDLQHVIKNFTEEDGNLFYTSKGKMIRLANFTVIPKMKVRTHTLKGDPEMSYVFDIKCGKSKNLVSKSLTIKYDELHNFTKALKKVAPLTLVYDDSPKASSLFNEYLVELLSHYEEHLECIDKFTFSGWYKLNDRYHYYSSLDKNCTCDLQLADISNEDPKAIIAQAFDFLKIAPINKILPIFLMMHSGYLYQVLKDAGIPLQFVFDIIGPTGSRKTSLSKVAFTLFQKDLIPQNIVNFTGTDRGIELVAEQHRDSILILDDLSNATNKANLQKFERLLRQVCDQTGRKRSMDGGKTLDSVDVQFGVVLTAESYFSELDTSSKLRNVAVFLEKNDINNSLLSAFQDNQRIAIQQNSSSYLDKYMTLIIRYIEHHYEEIVDEISGIHPLNNPSIKHARLEETRRVFYVITHIILKYVSSMEIYSSEECQQLSDLCRQIIDSMILENQELCEEEEPHILYLRALYHSIARGSFPVAPSKPEYESAPNLYLGFWDSSNKNTLKVLPSEAFSFINKYYASTGKSFNRPQSEVEQRLISEGICEGYKERQRSNPRPYKKVKVNGNSVNFLCFNMSLVNSIMEG